MEDREKLIEGREEAATVRENTLAAIEAEKMVEVRSLELSFSVLEDMG